jgi:acyl-CoA thioester hydrolase
MEKRFIFKENVRIYDTDAQGIVHYAGYYRFFTDALEQFVKDRIGGTFPLLEDGVWFVVVESNAKYYKPARVGDELEVSLSPTLLSEKVIKFNFGIERSGELLCDGYITQVALNESKWKSVPIPKKFVDRIFQKKS